MTTTLSIRSDVYLGRPHPEDGDRSEHLAYYVVAENVDGRRWAHFKKFTTESAGGRVFAELAIEQLLAKMEAAKGWKGPENNVSWTEIEPRYGSSAYESNQLGGLWY